MSIHRQIHYTVRDHFSGQLIGATATLEVEGLHGDLIMDLLTVHLEAVKVTNARFGLIHTRACDLPLQPPRPAAAEQEVSSE